MAPLRELMRSLQGSGAAAAALLQRQGGGGGPAAAAAAGAALRAVTFDDFAAAVEKLKPVTAAP